MHQPHDYIITSEPTTSRNRILFSIAIASFLFVAVVQALIQWNLEKIFDAWVFLGSSVALFFYTAVSYCFDHYLWRWKKTKSVMSLVGCSVPPNVAGDYRILLDWHDPHPEQGWPDHGKSAGIMTITQTWRSISVTIVFREGHDAPPLGNSYSTSAIIHWSADPRTVVLAYTYIYSGTSTRPVGGGVRELVLSGTCRCTLHRTIEKEPWHISGSYYSANGGTGTLMDETVPQKHLHAHSFVPE